MSAPRVRTALAGFARVHMSYKYRVVPNTMRIQKENSSMNLSEVSLNDVLRAVRQFERACPTPTADTRWLLGLALHEIVYSSTESSLLDIEHTHVSVLDAPRPDPVLVVTATNLHTRQSICFMLRGDGKWEDVTGSNPEHLQQMQPLVFGEGPESHRRFELTAAAEFVVSVAQAVISDVGDISLMVSFVENGVPKPSATVLPCVLSPAQVDTLDCYACRLLNSTEETFSTWLNTVL